MVVEIQAGESCRAPPRRFPSERCKANEEKIGRFQKKELRFLPLNDMDEVLDYQ